MHTLNAVKLITQHLMLGDFANVKRCCQSEAMPEKVAAWALATINEALTNQQKRELNEVTMAHYNGWKAYYEGDYLSSQKFFINALNSSSDDNRGVGLGLAKVCTRLGQWNTAKQWLLHELPYARQHNELFTQAQCYGALGEVFLRAHHPKLAYECFGNAFHILPKGSSQREKQYNYQASALMRTGNEDRAEQCLMSALYLAEDKQIDSVWHSLARLQYLWLQQNKSDSICDYYPQYLQQKPQIRVAEGFLMMALAFLANRQNDGQKAFDLADQAYSCFKNQFPTEAYWAKKLLYLLKGEILIGQVPLVSSIIEPEGHNYLIEAAWYSLELPNQGFEPLESAQTIPALWQTRLLFFI